MATTVTISGTVAGNEVSIMADTAAAATQAYWDIYNGLTTRPNPAPTPDPPVNG